MSEADKINPPHYQCGNIPAMEHIKTILTPEQFRGYLVGSQLKYLLRAGRKENEPADTDYAKAAWFKKRIEIEFPDEI